MVVDAKWKKQVLLVTKNLIGKTHLTSLMIAFLHISQKYAVLLGDPFPEQSYRLSTRAV
jgi:hypothetical protein